MGEMNNRGDNLSTDELWEQVGDEMAEVIGGKPAVPPTEAHPQPPATPHADEARSPAQEPATAVKIIRIVDDKRLLDGPLRFVNHWEPALRPTVPYHAEDDDEDDEPAAVQTAPADETPRFKSRIFAQPEAAKPAEPEENEVVNGGETMAETLVVQEQESQDTTLATENMDTGAGTDLEPLYVNTNPGSQDIVVAPWYSPVKHNRDRKFKELVAAWEPIVNREYELEVAGVELHDIETLRQDVHSLIGEKIDHALPPAILQSPAADFIRNEARNRGVPLFIPAAEEVEPTVSALGLLPYTEVAEANQRLDELVLKSAEKGVEIVLAGFTPLEAARRAAAVLSTSSSKAAETPLVVSVDQSDERFYVPAMQAARIVEHESNPDIDGIIPGRSDVPVTVTRPGDEKEETFAASVGMVQDLENSDITLIYALEPGMLPAPGRRLSDDENDMYGKLEISAVGVMARRFERRMQKSFNKAETRTVKVIGEGGAELVVEERRRTNLINGVKWLGNPNSIGIAYPKTSIKNIGAQAIESADRTEIIEDVEILED